jgi:putative ABC transport system permease protein
MPFLVQLALRNLLRNTRRTLLSMAAVIAGVAVLILGQGAIGGIEENIIRAQVDALSGHVLIRPVEYPTLGIQHPVDHLFGVDAALSSWLDANTTAWTTRVMFAPRLVHKADSMRVRAIGFDPVRDPTVFPRGTWNVHFADPPVEGGVLVSQGVARVLDVHPGDSVTMEGRTPAGAINALEMPVSGVYTAGNSALDRFTVFVPMALTADMLRNEDKVSHVIARLPSRDDSEPVAMRLREVAPAGTDVVTWQQETHDMIEVQKIRRTALDFLVIALMGMSALGIANTVLMAAYERVREIGTLRAMGMTRANVVAMFVIEGASMGLIGGVVGAALGGGLTWWYSTRGIDLSGAMKDMGNLAISSMLYFQWSSLVVVLAVVFGVTIAVIASIWPALVASNMQPADAVRAD